MSGPWGFDPAPLLALMDPEASSDEIGVRVGVSGSAVRMWRKGRGISAFVADRAAIELGLHPVLLWPSWPEPDRHRVVDLSQRPSRGLG